MTEELVYEVFLDDDDSVYLAIWFSSHSTGSAGQGACIGYEIHGVSDMGLMDYGEISYDPDEKDYWSIEEALSDILGSGFNPGTVKGTRPTGMSRADFGR